MRPAVHTIPFLRLGALDTDEMGAFKVKDVDAPGRRQKFE